MEMKVRAIETIEPKSIQEVERDLLQKHEEEVISVQEDVQEVATASASHIVHQTRRDVSSFTINVLPVDCWQALEVVASLCGPTIQDDPPYLLEFLLHDSSLLNSRNGWCRCECVPEAGGTTVHLTVGSSHEGQFPHIADVRDFLVDQLNSIDWSN